MRDENVAPWTVSRRDGYNQNLPEEVQKCGGNVYKNTYLKCLIADILGLFRLVVKLRMSELLN